MCSTRICYRKEISFATQFEVSEKIGVGRFRDCEAMERFVRVVEGSSVLKGVGQAAHSATMKRCERWSVKVADVFVIWMLREESGDSLESTVVSQSASKRRQGLRQARLSLWSESNEMNE